MNRREFLQGTAAVVAIGCVPFAPAAVGEFKPVFGWEYLPPNKSGMSFGAFKCWSAWNSPDGITHSITEHIPVEDRTIETVSLHRVGQEEPIRTIVRTISPECQARLDECKLDLGWDLMHLMREDGYNV